MKIANPVCKMTIKKEDATATSSSPQMHQPVGDAAKAGGTGRQKDMKSQKTIDWIRRSFLFLLSIATGLGGIAMGEAPAHELAIKGYDAVAYFTAGRALKGADSFTFQWHDMTWHFLTKENRNFFAADPKKYAPQYDGYCAWAMTEGRKAQTDPEVWKIVDGKLYLNCSMAAYERWNKDIPGNIKNADKNWLKYKDSN
jgi:YHS domain-containing protein